MSELTKEIEEKLSAPVPASAIQTKKQGGTDIRFTSDKWVISRLDSVVGVGGWSEHYTITTFAKPVLVKEYQNRRTGDMVQTFSVGQIVCDLTVLGVTKSSTVDILVEPGSYGTPATNAQARVFKRAAMKFGVAAELWNKDEEGESGDDGGRYGSNNSNSGSNGRSSNRYSGGGSEVSDKQKSFLRNLKVPGSVIDTLNKSTASKLLDILKDAKNDDEDEYYDDPAPFINDALKKLGLKNSSRRDDDEDED